MDTLYNVIYTFISTYIIPADIVLGEMDYFPELFAVAVTVGLFWLCIARPIKWLFTYGLFGGSKKNPLTKKRGYDD